MDSRQLTQLRMLQAPDPSFDAGDGLTIADVLAALRLHKWLILGCTLFCLACSAAFVKIQRPLYTATASLRIDPGRAISLGVQDGVAGSPNDDASLSQTEVGVLRSNRVAARVLNTLTPDEFKAATGFHRTLLDSVGPAQVLPQQQAKWIAAFERGLSVTTLEGTQLVSVSFTNRDPKVAASVVDRVLRAYQAQSLASRSDSVSELKLWLNDEIESLKAQIDKAQDELVSFQQAHNILGTEGTSNTTLDRLRYLNDRLTQAQAERIVKEGELRAAEAGTPEARAQLFPNPRLTELQTHRAELYSRYAQLASKFDLDYPPLVQVEKQIKMIDDEFSTDSESVITRLRQEFNADSYIEQSLQSQYQQQMSTAYSLNRNEAQYAVLQGEVTSGRELLGLLQSKLQQAVVEAAVNGVNVVVVDSPSVPIIPASPKPSGILFGGVFLGVFAGVSAALLFELGSDRVSGPQQVEQKTNWEVLGCLPRRPEQRPLHSTLRIAGSAETASREADAYRWVRNKLLLLDGAGKHKTILVAGVAGDGDTANAALNMAAALANAGFKALVVDANLRNPSLREYVESKSSTAGDQPALNSAIADVKAAKSVTNLSFITAAARGPNSSDELASTSFSSLMEQWSTQFDYVVLNAEPLLTSSDGLLLARFADTVVLVSRYQETRLSSLRKVKRMLHSTPVTAVGVLIDNVPSKRRKAAYDC